MDPGNPDYLNNKVIKLLADSVAPGGLNHPE